MQRFQTWFGVVVVGLLALLHLLAGCSEGGQHVFVSDQDERNKGVIEITGNSVSLSVEFVEGQGRQTVNSAIVHLDGQRRLSHFAFDTKDFGRVELVGAGTDSGGPVWLCEKCFTSGLPKLWRKQP